MKIYILWYWNRYGSDDEYNGCFATPELAKQSVSYVKPDGWRLEGDEWRANDGQGHWRIKEDVLVME
jgi:hypothetical protein